MMFRSVFVRVVFLLLLLAGAGRGFAQPSISSFTPAFGSSNDPSFITINGSGFSPGTLTVRFNGVRDTNAQAVASTQIQAHVPMGATNGSNPIFVQVGAASTFSAQDFTVIGSGPYVTDFSPTSGGGSMAVTINGTHFSTVTSVSFSNVSGTITAQSESQLTVTTPAGVKTGPIKVTSPQGTFITSSNFFAPPSVSGINPSSGRLGTNVTISGNNLLGTTSVKFNGVSASFTPPTNNTTLIAVAPTNATAGTIRVDAPAGAAFSGGNFVFQPTVWSFSPPSGAVGSSVTITGANFNASAPTVTFSGASPVAAASFSYGGITVTVPAAATNGPITVTTTDGSMTSTQIFYLPATISTFTPVTGAPGTQVKITGNQFFGTTNVTFNGVSVPAGTFKATNNTTIGVLVPAGVTTGPIGVATPAGTTDSGAFLFYGPPSISGFNPTHGLPGTNVVISGSNLTGTTNVLFNGLAAASVVNVNNGQVNAVVPTNAQTGPITVLTPGGEAVSATPFDLDYTIDLGVNLTDAPDPVFVGSNLVYSITVTNGGPFASPSVLLTNTFPPGVTIKGSSASQGTLHTNGNQIWGDLGNLGTVGSASITLTVAPQVVGSITNTVSVTGSYPETFSGNNSRSVVTTVLPFPFLSIQAFPPDQVRVLWPAPLSNFTLQFKGELSTNVAWSNDANPRTISGSNIFITESNAAAMRFYRLTN